MHSERISYCSFVDCGVFSYKFVTVSFWFNERIRHKSFQYEWSSGDLGIVMLLNDLPGKAQNEPKDGREHFSGTIVCNGFAAQPNERIFIFLNTEFVFKSFSKLVFRAFTDGKMF
mmetsp:Transcript_133046/g.197964  ORF Transcript_133046/g.197964 Transcript_133046/m.197964 type:complete len:115 (+) Transcript_133046:30-374(+)